MITPVCILRRLLSVRARCGRSLLSLLPFLLILSGCETYPRHEAWELSSYKGDETLKFFRAELSRVAPELDRENFHYPLAVYGTDHRTGYLLRSGTGVVYLEDEGIERLKVKRHPYVKLQWKPTGNKHETEISVYTGHGRWSKATASGLEPVGILIGASAGGGNTTSREVGATASGVYGWEPLDEKLYRRRVIPLP